jgi:hypothetical protein
MTDHEPNVETWNCRQCGAQWPCEPARTHMMATMTPTELRISQWMMLERAVFDLQPINSREVWDRFLGWAGRDPLS